MYKISEPWHAGFLRYGIHKKALPRTTTGNNLSVFHGIASKSNLIIYTSSLINIKDFITVAKIIFEISCCQGQNAKNCK